jgi:non-specific serine/threonine protein kinase
VSDDRWQRVKAIFEAALDRHGALRDAFLDAECAGDDTLRAEIALLLDAALSGQGAPEPGASVVPWDDLPTRPSGRVTGSFDSPSSAAMSRGHSLPRRCPSCGARYEAFRRVCAIDGSVLDEDAEALIGSTFDGRYRVEAVLGRGGMGIVLRARHATLDDVVAIKLLDDRYASDPSALRRFVREGQIARRFHHPAVVGIHDLVCGDTGPVYLVLEYVEGRTLGELLRERGQFSPREVIEIVRPIGDALDAAHARGIVHRDLKPENIMVRDAPAEPRAKLLDLGIAITRATADHGADTRLTRQGHWIGTPLYMAPEQWNASAGESGMDGRADVYSLGVVVHQLVSGATPFTGDIGALRTLHLEGRPRRLDTAVAGVPRAFADAVARAMAKQRADRFATAGVFVAALESALESAPADTGADETRQTLVGVAAAPYDMPVSGAATRMGDVAATGESERAPGNLPAQATSFVAPDGAVDGVAQAFERSRCVTLTGPGGIGKTRLSLEVAARLDERFPDGTWFVELAGVADPTLVERAVADTLGARERPGEPLATSIHERIGDSRLLVVLDNCEHLVDSAAAVASNLMRACPRASVLATSREALAIPGETVVAVAPLPVPPDASSAAVLSESPAVQLFLDRARAAAPAFAPGETDLATIAAICRRLDGLPLAIELAAARVRALGIAEVFARLDDRFRLLSASERGRTSRQRTLHAAIDWSVRSLAPAERLLLCRLAAFAGGATLDALERVATDDVESVTGEAEIPACDVADLVEGLVAKSLVVADLERDPVRYRMFESIRAFALDVLDKAGGRTAVEARIDSWVAEMAEACAAARATADQTRVELQFFAEMDTARASLARLLARDDGGAALAATAGALGSFFESRGLLSEGRKWLESAIAAGSDQPARALALYWSGVLAVDQGDYAVSEARLEEALALDRAADDREGLARTLRALAYLAMRRNQVDRAEKLAAEAGEYFRGLGDIGGEASTTHLIATVAIGRGDYATALPLLERTGEIHRRRGNLRSLAINLYSMAEVLAGTGKNEEAARHAAEAVAIAEGLDDPQTLAYATYVVGWVAFTLGEAEKSALHLRRALAMARALGDESACIYAIEGIAEALTLLGDDETAVVLVAATKQHREATGQPLPPFERTMLEERLARSRAKLGEAGTAAAESRGKRLGLEEALEMAMGN